MAVECRCNDLALDRSVFIQLGIQMKPTKNFANLPKCVSLENFPQGEVDIDFLARPLTWIRRHFRQENFLPLQRVLRAEQLIGQSFQRKLKCSSAWIARRSSFVHA